MSVFVLDKRQNPLMPCSEKRARLLLNRGRARIHRIIPFTIRLVDRYQEDSELQHLEIKIDPGSKFTGLALVRKKDKTVVVKLLLEIEHKGSLIKKQLEQRSGHRRFRRSRLRYRPARFSNRNKPEGWLPPSLQHRVNSTMSLVNKLRKSVPVTSIAVERVKFDTQKMQNPEISGIEYQQGELQGYEVREYLLEKWGRRCAYCNKEGIPLQVDHIIPKAKCGSNRVSNLTLACQACNTTKSNRSLEDFAKPEVCKRILAYTKVSLRDAAAINSTRNFLYKELLATGLPVDASTGARTKFNRSKLIIPKTHALDAVCIGDVEDVVNWKQPTLHIKAMGRGSYKRTRSDKYGFPIGYCTRHKRHFGFQTGDLVVATVVKGKRKGTHKGRVTIRENGKFDLKSKNNKFDVSYKYCKMLQLSDGYKY